MDNHLPKAYSICGLPGVRELCRYLIRNFSDMEPVFDPDGDKFSSSEVRMCFCCRIL